MCATCHINYYNRPVKLKLDKSGELSDNVRNTSGLVKKKRVCS